MFDELIEKLDTAFRKIRGQGKLTEKNIEDALREIRRILLEADVHYKVAKSFIGNIKTRAVGREVLRSITPGQQVVKIVYDELTELLGSAAVPVHFGGDMPAVIMLVGLQGSGKTTTAAKIGAYLRKRGRLPLLVAADIYRPAAIEQLKTLGQSSDLPVFEMGEKDPADIAGSAVRFARKNSHDTLILDTAGRLHVDDAMMAELVAVRRAVNPVEILFVADGMTGQDAVRSAEAFLEQLDFQGVILTKMDGDAKGGAALSIRAMTDRPVKFITTGEKIDAIEPFYPDRLASRILGMGDVVSLVEKAQDAVDAEKAEKLARQLKNSAFTFEDFLDQLHQVKKMGPLEQVMGLIPGMDKQMKNVSMDDNALIRIEAMIHSMTREERYHPNIINGSRRKRIASGSGTTVQDVNKLLKQFQMMQKMIKQMGKMRKGKFSRELPMPFSL